MTGPNCIQASSRRDDALEHQLDPAAAGLAADEARTHDPGVVEDQEIARNQQLGQGSKGKIDKPRPCDVQQAASRALRRGNLRDQLARQIEIEIGKAVGLAGCHRAARSKMSAV